jgi:hypothetical protein
MLSSVREAGAWVERGDKKKRRQKKGRAIEVRGPKRGESNGVLHGREEVPLRPSESIMQISGASSVNWVTEGQGKEKRGKGIFGLFPPPSGEYRGV